jgi:hypothetical protein
MQITKWLLNNPDNMTFCGKIINDIRRNHQRNPFRKQKINKRGEILICVADDSICMKHQRLIYKTTGEPLLPEY